MQRISGLVWLIIVLVLCAGLVAGILGTSYANRTGPFALAPTMTSTPTAIATATPLPTGTSTSRPTSTPTLTPTPSPTPVITALPPLPQGFLVTVRQPVQVHKTYDAAPDWWPNFPPFSLLRGHFTLVATGLVAAGVDFAALPPDAVHRRGNSIDITLPAPQVYEPVTIDLSQTMVIEDPGIRGKDLDKLLTAQSDVSGLMEDWAVQHGLLDTARQNATTQVELWLRRLGFTDVNIHFAPATPTAVPY